MSYSQILKKMFKDNSDRILENYYLLYFSGMDIDDFDFVSKFRYSLEENGSFLIIRNILGIEKNEEKISDRPIKNIFQFEADIVKTIFNSFLVGGNDKKFWANYFGKIKPDAKDINGDKMQDCIFQMIYKYRKAFYDYIYKSKTQAINSSMWDEIMLNSIISDLRLDTFTDRRYHSKENSIKDKLNIWFSLYNYFINNKERDNMASKIPELSNKMNEVVNNDNKHFESIHEYAFGAGQLIRSILNKSESSERSHSLLEPFLQKTKIEQLNLAIARSFENYKHSFKFYKGEGNRYAFDKIMSEVMGFESDEDLKKQLPMILAGYFAKSVFINEMNNEK